MFVVLNTKTHERVRGLGFTLPDLLTVLGWSESDTMSTEVKPFSKAEVIVPLGPLEPETLERIEPYLMEED